MSRSCALLAAPVEGDAIAAARDHVAVQAVVGDVQRAAGEPLVERRIVVVEHPLPRLEPVELLGLRGPPRLRVARGLLVDGGVVQQGVLAELRRGVEASRPRAARRARGRAPRPCRAALMLGLTGTLPASRATRCVAARVALLSAPRACAGAFSSDRSTPAGRAPARRRSGRESAGCPLARRFGGSLRFARLCAAFGRVGHGRASPAAHAGGSPFGHLPTYRIPIITSQKAGTTSSVGAADRQEDEHAR